MLTGRKFVVAQTEPSLTAPTLHFHTRTRVSDSHHSRSLASTPSPATRPGSAGQGACRGARGVRWEGEDRGEFTMRCENGQDTLIVAMAAEVSFALH
jgi:hypothetical protein